ncbi:MAG: serine hydrolase domain-containing protein [Hungatella sp.]
MKSLWNADLGEGTYRNPILYTDCSDPEGIPKKALDAYFRYIQQGEVKLHSFMLLRGTHVLEERYFGSIHKETPQRMYSISKSMTSIAIGILIRDGKINLQDKICQYFPDKLPGGKAHPWIEAMTITHMLTMSTAHEKTTYKDYGKDDWVESFFTVPPDYPPGTVFSYDTSSSHVLAALVERVSGMSITEFLKQNFLTEIGADQHISWLTDPMGVSEGGSGFSCTTEELSKIAYVCNHYGNFFGKQILDEAYMRAATGVQIDTGKQSTKDEQQGYGFQFWRVRHHGFALYGMGGQLAVCFPDKDFIYITTADAEGGLAQTTKLYEAFWKYIYPFIESPLRSQMLLKKLR